MRRPLPSHILILGATSAIAMAVAEYFAPRGARFFLVARNPEKLDAVRRNLLVRGAASVSVCALDLNNTCAHHEMLVSAARDLGTIDLALIAHGILGDQKAAEVDYQVAEQVLHTNFLSSVSLITWFANYFETNRRGTLAVIGSVAGDRGRKSNYVYGASKGALAIFVDGVRNRIDRVGVHVLSIRPGFVDTPMTAHLPKGFLFASPETVTKGIINAVRKRKDVVYVPAFWKPIMFVIRHIPTFIFKKMQI